MRNLHAPCFCITFMGGVLPFFSLYAHGGSAEISPIGVPINTKAGLHIMQKTIFSKIKCIQLI
jgi:hypothetical protein